jgi:hypothetical protein
MGTRARSGSLAVRRISLRNILVALCVLISILLLVSLQAVYTGTLPTVVATWSGPPPSGATQLRNPFRGLPAFGGRRPSRIQDILTSIPAGSELGVHRGLNNDENNYKCAL